MLSPDDQVFFSNRTPHLELTEQQYEKIESTISSSPVMKITIEMLSKAGVEFTIAGSFASFTMGILEEFNDIDVYINSTSLETLPGFKDLIRDLKAIDEYVAPKILRTQKIIEKYGDHPSSFICEDFEISMVHKITPLIGPPIDLVLAPKATFAESNLYGLYIIKSFDYAAARVALFKPFSSQSWRAWTLSLPNKAEEFISPFRQCKYAFRPINLTPSLLSTLSMNTLIESKQITYDHKTVE